MSRYHRLPYPSFPSTRRASPAAGSGSNRPAFTVIELIICMGVVAILCGILLPSVRATRQAAQRVSCASGMRQIGVGLSMYANTNSDRICRSVNAEGSTPQRQELMAVRLRNGVASAGPNGWDGLGLLVAWIFMSGFAQTLTRASVEAVGFGTVLGGAEKDQKALREIAP